MPNVFSTTDVAYPGYFRIGFVILQIPPMSISTNKVVNDDQLATIRGFSPMFIKSGQARWDVTINWKAIRFHNADDTYDYTQWTDLRNIVAMFRAAPFVEIENSFLRQHFTNLQLTTDTQRMAFALRQLRIDTNPDSTNVIDVVLTMSLFNYSPYSKDFGYQDSHGDSVSATESNRFKSFISRWVNQNIDNHPGSLSSPPIIPWNEQDEGVVSIKWREYAWSPFPDSASSTQPPTTPSSVAYKPIIPPARIPKRISSKKLSNEIQQILNEAAANHNLDPAIVTALCIYESGGKPRAGEGRTDHGGLGLMQLVASTAKKLGVHDVFDPVQNADGGCRYLRQMLDQFGNYNHALGAYNAGPAYIYAYRDGKTYDHGKINPDRIRTSDGLPPAGIPTRENTPKYVRTILTNAGYASQVPTVIPQSTDGQPPPTQVDSSIISVPDPKYRQMILQLIPFLPDNGIGWYLDYYTEQGAFFFKENQITLASADSLVDGDYDMFPNQISLVLVNNLPLIPLAAMQYPTYQHVGPTDTMISVSFNSVGSSDDPTAEPEHGGIQALSAISSRLEDQFHRFRTLVRSVSSIHRMQAIFLQNQVLNLLGVQGAMLRGLNTETIPESADLAQVSLLASQYENIFEESSPFRMNGIPSAYSAPLKDVLTSGTLSKMSKEEQNAIVAVKQFSDAWAAKDEKYLRDQILAIVREKDAHPPLDVLTDMASITSAGLNPVQQNFLLGLLDLDTTKGLETDTNKPSIASQLLLTAQAAFNEITGTYLVANTHQSDDLPGLAARRNILKAPGKSMTYADYFIFTQLPVTGDQSLINNIRKQVETHVSSIKPSIIDAMYSTLFDWEVLTNPIFSRQSQLITNSPLFTDKFKNVVKVGGPSSDPGNAGHGCYRDLGLTDYAEDPALYFKDWNQNVRDDANATLTTIMNTANQAANDVNKIATTRPTVDPATLKSIPISDLAQQLPGQANTLIRMTNLPAYSMNSAYPTFKLMLIEEDNTGPFFAFDNFYSYSSVQDIEIIKYRDKPDTAIIQITNLAHLLQHRLYDDSAAGKMEKDADKFNIAPGGGLASTGEATTGGSPTAGITASKVAAGIDYQYGLRKNMTEGRGEASNRVPLKYFALQTGSKIQVRMGFSNNPDNLYPVFTGQVTDIDGDDILTITCQSFQLEMMNVPGTTVKKDSRLGFNFSSGGAAFGGFQIMNSGTTSNIMKTMLSSPATRHFGYWQINRQPDKLIKGFEWTELTGKAIQSISNNKKIQAIGALLQTGYDRSGENILINSVINLDASQSTTSIQNRASRTFDDENPNVLIGTAAYSIPKQSKMSVWDIIRDVSRRYPHYNLMVRDYGFPYGADATLVYGHPLDWYYSRAKLLGEDEKEKADNNAHGNLYKQWWDSIGSKKWNDIFNRGVEEASTAGFKFSTANILAPGIQTILQGILVSQRPDHTQMASSGPEGLESAVASMHNILNGKMDPHANFLWSVGAFVSNLGNLSAGTLKAVDADFQSLYREWEVYLHLSDPASNSSRLKPIRKYHLIDHNHIVHNGINVNDNIYNAVRIKDEKPRYFNQNIADIDTQNGSSSQPHIRCLDVTDMINNPDQNLLQSLGTPMVNAYAQSFLRDEVGKMYSGELILRGVPEIEPFDVILLSDPSTGIVGPVEVDSVIHSFNMEQGYITIVKPRLMVLVNETCSLGLIASLGLAWAGAQANIMDLGSQFNVFSGNVNIGISNRLVGAAAGAGAVLALTAGLAFAANPIGLGILALTAGIGIVMYAQANSTKNYFRMMPLSRFGRPWLGGVQGFEISNFAYSISKSFKWFQAEEIAPTIESWNELLHYRADIIYPTMVAK